MDATNTQHAILVSMLQPQLVSNADGALVVLLTTRIMETLPSNVVVSRLENHMISLAQLNSELLTAVDSTATSLLTSAVNQTKDNSQLWKHATRPALSLLNSRNATTLPRNARHVITPRTQIAKTQVLTVKLLAMYHMLNAMKLLELVDHVIQLRIRTAHRLKVPAEKNARRTPNLSATIALENVPHAQADKVVLKVQLVTRLARRYHQTKPMPATGPNNHQPVSKIQREPSIRNHALSNAKLHHSESATSRLVSARNASKAVIQNVFKLLTSVKHPTKRSISAKLKHLKAYTE